MHVPAHHSSVKLAGRFVRRATIRAGRLHIGNAVPVAQVPRGQAQLGQILHYKDQPPQLLLTATYRRIGYCYCYIY